HEKLFRFRRKSLQLQWCRVVNLLFRTVGRTTLAPDNQTGELGNGELDDLVAIEGPQVHIADVNVGPFSHLPSSLVQQVLSARGQVKVDLLHRAPRRRLMLLCSRRGAVRRVPPLFAMDSARSTLYRRFQSIDGGCSDSPSAGTARSEE